MGTICKRKHTAYQPSKEEWVCPKCGSPEFFIDLDPDLDDDEFECELLHADDFIRCDSCDYETTGRTFVKNLKKLKDLTTCPCCRGKGVVSSKKAREIQEIIDFFKKNRNEDEKK